jgi:hypothetical protein
MGNCPYCNKQAMTLLRQCFLGPESGVHCMSCGKSVAVPWVASLAALPVALGIVATIKFPLPWSIAGLLLGLVAYVVIQWAFVPLVPREPPTSG